MSFLLPGNRLYYYCKLPTALKYILPTNTLLLSPILKTNDPRENKSFFFGGIFPAGMDTTKWEEYNNRVSYILRNDCKILCFSSDFKNNWGFQSSRMWAYYGGNHKGLCLMLNKEEFLKENKDLINLSYFRNVKYFNSKRPVKQIKVDYTFKDSIGMEAYLKKRFRPKYLDYLYFTKNKEWEFEREIRLVHFSKGKVKEYCSIKKSLTNIYTGVDFRESRLPELFKLCPDVDFYKLKFIDHALHPYEIEK